MNRRGKQILTNCEDGVTCSSYRWTKMHVITLKEARAISTRMWAVDCQRVIVCQWAEQPTRWLGCFVKKPKQNNQWEPGRSSESTVTCRSAHWGCWQHNVQMTDDTNAFEGSPGRDETHSLCACLPDGGAGLQADPEHRRLQLQRHEQPAGGEVCPQWGQCSYSLLNFSFYLILFC